MVDFPKLSISGFSLFLTKTSDQPNFLNQIFSNAFLAKIALQAKNWKFQDGRFLTSGKFTYS